MRTTVLAWTFLLLFPTRTGSRSATWFTRPHPPLPYNANQEKKGNFQRPKRCFFFCKFLSAARSHKLLVFCFKHHHNSAKLASYTKSTLIRRRRGCPDELARIGNLYARRNPRPRQDRAPIRHGGDHRPDYGHAASV